MAHIYVITNTVNGKQYVGKTNENINKRLQEHIRDSRRQITEKRPLHRAIRKYGIGPNVWKLETIDNAQTQEELNQKEQYWIKYYNSVEEGYNETDAISKCGGNTY